jgi:histone acetyltransferase (RNA polymerase elongator complex component)
MVKTQPENAGSKTRHYTIPVFIPGIACPFQCIFCDQEKITGHQDLPSPEKVVGTIRKHLSTIPVCGTTREVGFFGGTFTGLPTELQELYLGLVQPFLDEGSVSSIRLSTRPDHITPDILNLLRKHHVGTIELGAQSMDDTVLKAAFRGHTAADTEEASKLIKANGFSLGLQMMIGLPGDSEETDLRTVEKFISLKADFARVYPVLVIRETPLETIYRSGKYRPLTLEEAVHRCGKVLLAFEQHDIPVIRMGLHPSDGLLQRTELVAGPFHPSFRELVLSDIWYDRLMERCKPQTGTLTPDSGESPVESAIHTHSPDPLLKAGKGLHGITISVNPADLNHATGYCSRNKKALQKLFEKVVFKGDPFIEIRTFHVDYF